MNINILILSSGRRVELVKCFKDAAEKLNIKSNIVTVDLSETAPAMYFGDSKYTVPRIGEEGYLEKLVEICNLEDIRAVIPTIDTELLYLAKNKELIEKKTKAKVLISPVESINICRNKSTTAKFLMENGFNTPREVLKEDIRNKNYEFPLFIKPIDGSSSINTYKVNNLEELEFFLKYIDKPILQEFISGKEYTVDVFLDFESNPISIVPRERIQTRGGEISKGLVVKNKLIIDEVKKLVKVFKGIGNITVQCMVNDGIVNFIEINPRFGGGAPMSIKAGADSPEKIYRILMGEKLSYSLDYNDEILFLRYDSSIGIDEKSGELIKHD